MSRPLAVIGLALIALGSAFALAPRPDAIAPPVRSIVDPAPPSASAAPWHDSGPIPPGYRIQIPRLGIDLPIVEGDIERDSVQLRTPEDVALHLPGTAIPGEDANAYLYAHARRGMFITLWNARSGDEVWISTPDGRALRYVITEIHPSVAPGDVSWAAATAPGRLTLQTSTGPNPGDPRFVVVARPG